ncbi:MAG TPA: efflux transporter outer membrane subunit [Xanthobacteraceae bacterium]|nr:efflux transporter outer membrane subunit [Xanthobacteraceae bacterium]
MVEVKRVLPWGRCRLLPALAMSVALLPALAGCLATADKLDPALDVPDKYVRAKKGDPEAALPPLDWWTLFRSPELTDLMEQAQTANLDIAVAIAQIVQADALARQTGSALLPLITAGATDTRSRASVNSGSNAISVTDRTNYMTTMNASYVLDFWGHNRALTRAAENAASASRFAREVVALTTLVSVANTYFMVLEAQDRIRVARDNVQAAERILKVIEDRFAQGGAAPLGAAVGASGSGSALDVAQQASLVAIARASIPPLVEQLDQNRAALALLVGRAPEHIRIHGGSMYRLAIPRVTPGLPSELLTQRPDIREAEQQLAEADANVEAARAAFFPTIQLTGQGGFSSSVLSALFVQNSGFYSAAVGIGSSVAASTAQTIFDGGLLLGQLDQQKGIREQMLAAYRKAVISAFTDVEKALVGVEQITLQEVLQRRAVAEARKAFDLSEQKLRQGALDLTTLIQVEETLFTQEDMLAQVRFNRLEALVSLYQALGGGWLPRKEAQKP